MSGQTVSVDQALSHAVNSYFSGKYNDAVAVLEQVLKVQPGLALALMLSSLLQWRAGKEAQARQLMEKIESAAPKIRDYDYKQGLAKRQGRSDWLSLNESRVLELVKMSGTTNFIISYPKCGRTWLRMILGVYLLNGKEGDPIELLNLTQSMPDVPNTEVSHDDYPMWKHIDDMVESKSVYDDKRVVWLVRDPRDTFVSYYFQHTRRKDGQLARDDFSGSMGDFIHHPVGGLDSIIKFYNIWANNLTVPRETHVVSYEDLHARPQEALKELIAFLGFPDYGSEAIEKAIEYCRFDNMKEIERKNLLNNPRLQTADDADPEAFKVRKGKVGGYKDYLSEAEIEELERVISRDLDPYYHRFGYV